MKRAEALERLRLALPDLRRDFGVARAGNARAMRNILTHGYEAVSFDIVWHTLQENLPPLEAALRDNAQRFEEQGCWGAS